MASRVYEIIKNEIQVISYRRKHEIGLYLGHSALHEIYNLGTSKINFTNSNNIPFVSKRESCNYLFTKFKILQ